MNFSILEAAPEARAPKRLELPAKTNESENEAKPKQTKAKVERKPSEKKRTEKQEKYYQKRKKLIGLSKVVKMGMDSGAIDCGTVNEGLKEIYAQDGHTELNTFKQWKEQGAKIKKGSTALLLWGKPRNNQQGEDDESEETKFFPMAYLFSNLQIEKNV